MLCDEFGVDGLVGLLFVVGDGCEEVVEVFVLVVVFVEIVEVGGEVGGEGGGLRWVVLFDRGVVEVEVVVFVVGEVGEFLVEKLVCL